MPFSRNLKNTVGIVVVGTFLLTASAGCGPELSRKELGEPIYKIPEVKPQRERVRLAPGAGKPRRSFAGPKKSRIRRNTAEQPKPKVAGQPKSTGGPAAKPVPGEEGASKSQPPATPEKKSPDRSAPPEKPAEDDAN